MKTIFPSAFALIKNMENANEFFSTHQTFSSIFFPLFSFRCSVGSERAGEGHSNYIFEGSKYSGRGSSTQSNGWKERWGQVASLSCENHTKLGFLCAHEK